MSYRSIILGTICAAALSAAPLSGALADGFSNFHGTVSGNYAHTDASNGGGNWDSYGIDGSGAIGLGMSDLNAEIDASYHHATVVGIDLNSYRIGGTLFYAPSGGAIDGRVGATFNYDYLDADIGSGHVNNYGGFAEWYLNHTFTFSAKGGGFDASGNVDGYYLGAQIKAYVCPDIALSGSIDHAKINTYSFANETDYTFEGEWMFTDNLPLSVYAGYAASDLSGTSSNLDTYFIGLRLYTDGNGATSLRDRQRTGNIGWAVSFAPKVLF